MKIFFSFVILVSISTSAFSMGSNFSKMIFKNRLVLLPVAAFVNKTIEDKTNYQSIFLCNKINLPIIHPTEFMAVSYCDDASGENNLENKVSLKLVDNEFEKAKELWFTPISIILWFTPIPFWSSLPQVNWRDGAVILAKIATNYDHPKSFDASILLFNSEINNYKKYGSSLMSNIAKCEKHPKRFDAIRLLLKYGNKEDVQKMGSILAQIILETDDEDQKTQVASLVKSHDRQMGIINTLLPVVLDYDHPKSLNVIQFITSIFSEIDEEKLGIYNPENTLNLIILWHLFNDIGYNSRHPHALFIKDKLRFADSFSSKLLGIDTTSKTCLHSIAVQHMLEIIGSYKSHPYAIKALEKLLKSPYIYSRDKALTILTQISNRNDDLNSFSASKLLYKYYYVEDAGFNIESKPQDSKFISVILEVARRKKAKDDTEKKEAIELLCMSSDSDDKIIGERLRKTFSNSHGTSYFLYDSVCLTYGWLF